MDKQEDKLMGLKWFEGFRHSIFGKVCGTKLWIRKNLLKNSCF